MTRHIIAYSDLRSFRDSEAYRVLYGLPQIAVQRALIDGMYPKDALGNPPLLDYPATTFNNFIMPIVRSWSSPSTMIDQLDCIRKFLKSQIDSIEGINEKKEELTWLKACRKNAFSILSSIILFEEAGIRPEDLPELNRNLILLKRSWYYLYNNDYSIKDFRDLIESVDAGDISDLLQRSFNNTHIDTIVIHGFFFITPLQERVFRALESCGINLLFLICYDERYPYANEVINRTFSESHGFEDKSKWEMIKGDEVNPIGELFENRSSSLKNLTVTKYATLYDFSRGIDAALTTGYKIFSPDSKAANELMLDFFPHRYPERSLLNYPVGQFILLLHRMWDQDERLTLTPDLVEECLSSGWIDVDGHSSREIMSEYGKIKNYFRDCRHIEDWEKRLDKLESIKADIDAEFTISAVDRWEEIMGNPFHSISTLSISLESMKLLRKSIEMILAIATRLFSEDEISISEHLEKLKNLLNEHGHTQELYEEEKRVITTLFSRMESLRGKRYSPDSILDAISIFLGGPLNGIHEDLVEAEGMISPMFKIDGTYATEDDLVHICLCDLKRLPGKADNYVWPLSKGLLKTICNNAPTTDPVLSNAIDISESTPLNNRYLVYLAAKSRNLTISWVSQMDGKELQPSPYITLMKVRCDKKIAEHNSARMKELSEGEYEVPQVSSFGIMDADFIAPEGKYEYASCGLRYLYGYILDKYPSYSSEFHQTFILEGLLKSLSYVIKDDDSSVEELKSMILSWMEGIRDSEKRQLSDNSNIVEEMGGKYTDYNGFRYSGIRFYAEFPRHILDRMNAEYLKLNTPDGRKSIDISAGPISPKICMYCPHSEHCINVEYAVDNGGKYGKN